MEHKHTRVQKHAQKTNSPHFPLRPCHNVPVQPIKTGARDRVALKLVHWAAQRGPGVGGRAGYITVDCLA